MKTRGINEQIGGIKRENRGINQKNSGIPFKTRGIQPKTNFQNSGIHSRIPESTEKLIM
ncbi:hypothetical protein [Neobacillus mesonae]|uniref:hypothetical protein n=1 Tax=Neobacillus mesonae TaxID=1193713 RepID=UPI002E1F820C|nr:hypothetical protein [Neobacillus mesonae]